MLSPLQCTAASVFKVISNAFTEVAGSDSTKTRARVGGKEDMREELPWSNHGHPSPYR